MSKECKYYYKSHVNFSYSSVQRQPQLIKWNKRYYVEVNENLDCNQDIYVTVDKLPGENFDKPKSNEYEKVKPILEDLFNDYYYQALRYINETDTKEGEYYLLNNSKRWYQIEYYSHDIKQGNSLSIDFRDSIEDLWLMIHNSRSFKSRPNARKNGSPIKREDFLQFVNLTLKYLSDPYSYEVYLDAFVKNFYRLVTGEKNTECFDISAERAFKIIMQQLEQRKTTIEKQLIENDNETSSERIKLRGEIAGINYAISTIKINK